MLDVVTFLETIGIGKRMTDLFTAADLGAFKERPLSILVQHVPGSQAPAVTEPVDYVAVTIAIAGAYGQVGEEAIHNKADEVYRALTLVLDATINGTLYLSMRAVTSPAVAGQDENGRTVIEFNVEMMRYRG